MSLDNVRKLMHTGGAMSLDNALDGLRMLGRGFMRYQLITGGMGKTDRHSGPPLWLKFRGVDGDAMLDYARSVNNGFAELHEETGVDHDTYVISAICNAWACGYEAALQRVESGEAMEPVDPALDEGTLDALREAVAGMTFAEADRQLAAGGVKLVRSGELTKPSDGPWVLVAELDEAQLVASLRVP